MVQQHNEYNKIMDNFFIRDDLAYRMNRKNSKYEFF